MSMMDESAMSTSSLASSSDTDFGSNGRFVECASLKSIVVDAQDRISISPNPESQIAAYRQDDQRHEQIALGIRSVTMTLTALPLLAYNPFPVSPPAGHFNRTAAMFGGHWMKKAQTWPMDAQQVQRHVSLASRARARVMAMMQRDLEAF